MIRVFFDSSVLIAAFLSPSGGSAKTLSHIRQKKIAGLISLGVMEEILDKVKKFGKTEEEIAKFVDQKGLVIGRRVKKAEVEKYLNKISDPDDAHILASAEILKCDFLVSLDRKHILAVKKNFSPLRILLPGELIRQLEEDFEALSSPSFEVKRKRGIGEGNKK